MSHLTVGQIMSGRGTSNGSEVFEGRRVFRHGVVLHFPEFSHETLCCNVEIQCLQFHFL